MMVDDIHAFRLEHGDMLVIHVFLVGKFSKWTKEKMENVPIIINIPKMDKKIWIVAIL